MIRSNSDTTTTSTYSPTPTSPFSSNVSVPSEPTSDETPDLGAFTAVLRAWSHLQPPPRVVNASLANAQQDVPSTTTSRTLSSFSSATHSRNLNNTHSEIESDTDLRDNQSTVWAHRRIASYLNYIGDTSTHHNTDTESQTDRDRDRPVSVFSSETIGEPEPELQTEHEDTDTRGLTVPIRDIDELDSSYDNDIYDDDNDDDDENDHHHRLDETEVIDERSSLPPSQTEQEPQYELEEEEDEDEDPNGRTPLNLETLIDFGEELGEQPSLGYLDEALKFIAAERERFTAQREAGIVTNLTNGIEPRKRRRRKRTKTPRAHSTTRTTTSSTITATSKSTLTGADDDADDPDADADESSSSYDQNYSTSYSTSNYTSSSAAAIPLFKSAPGTPGASRRARGRDRRQRHPHQLPSNPNPSQIASTTTNLGKQRHLKHSRSTPQLRILQRDTDEDDEVIESPRVAQLRALGRKLETLFPEDVDYLKKVRYTMLTGLSPTSAGRGGEMGTVYGSGSGSYGPHPPKNGGGPVGGKRSPGGVVEGDALGTGPGGIFGGFIDTRGPPPIGSTSDTMPQASTNTNGTGKGRQDKGRAKKKVEEDEKLIHVFVDHSNILIGLINYLKRYPQKHPQYRDLLGGITSGNGNASVYASASASASASPQNGSAINNVAIPSGYPKPPKHLSHSALTLILERGRPVTRRVLVTSSPLYQPMESATMLGFDVKVFARVPDYGDGLDRDRDRERENADRVGVVTRVENGNGRKKTHKRSVSSGSFSGLTRETSASASGTSGSASASANDVSPKKGRRRAGSVNNGLNMNNNSNTNIASGGVLGRRKSHKRQTSGSNSTESEQGTGNVATRGFPQAFVRSLSGPASGVIGGNSPSNSNAVAATIPSMSTPQRIRYREQGVDELLQLKLHQVLAALDGPPPPGSTIILVTGDGNAGQYNEDGFLGGVRTALKKGWKVELYAWEGGLSRAWNREFGEGSELGSGFKVIGLEQFGTELVEIYY